MNWRWAIDITPEKIFKSGEQVGTASNQVLLGILVVVLLLATVSLIGVVVYLHKQDRKTRMDLHKDTKDSNDQILRENKQATELLLRKMEERELITTTERKEHITTLLMQQKEDIEVKKDVMHAIVNNTQAIEHNNVMIEKLQSLMDKVLDRVIK